MQLHTSQQNNSFQFVVNKKQVSKNKTLKTSILYDKIIFSANQSITLYNKMLNSNLKSFEFNILKNAYLNDELIVKHNIQKLNNSELKLKITVTKKREKNQDIICNAIFGYAF